MHNALLIVAGLFAGYVLLFLGIIFGGHHRDAWRLDTVDMHLGDAVVEGHYDQMTRRPVVEIDSGEERNLVVFLNGERLSTQSERNHHA